jgi:hypothetical protein
MAHGDHVRIAATGLAAAPVGGWCTCVYYHARSIATCTVKQIEAYARYIRYAECVNHSSSYPFDSQWYRQQAAKCCIDRLLWPGGLPLVVCLVLFNMAAVHYPGTKQPPGTLYSD